MRYFIFILIISTFSGFLSGCQGEEWKGWVYPNMNDLTKSDYIGEFKSLEACRSSAKSSLGNLDALDSGDYECGLNCKQKYGTNVCKKTLR